MEKITLEVEPFDIDEMEYDRQYIVYDERCSVWRDVSNHGGYLYSGKTGERINTKLGHHNFTHMARLPCHRRVTVTWIHPE